MSAFFGLLSISHAEVASGVARLTAGALIAGLWQGVLLCVATVLVLRTLPKSTAALRFMVWAAVFSASVAMPFVNLSGVAFAERAGAATASHLTFDGRWGYLLAAMWIAAAAYRICELALQVIGLRALWKTSLPVASEGLAGLDAPLVVAGRKVELCTSDEVDRPSVIGFFAPRILIPTWLFAQLTATELNHIVLHEMEHLRRRDDWVNLLQKIGLVLLPLNPALFWIDRRLSTERELACDDGVLEQTRMPRAYAASLASIAERRIALRTHPRMGALALAATGLRRKRSELGRRIESILGRRATMSPAFASGLAAMLVAGVVGSAALLARAPQLVSFSPGVATQQASANPASGTHKVVASEMLGKRTMALADGFQDVSFHSPVKARAAKAKSLVRKKVPAEAAQRIAEDRVILPADQEQFVVLTSWESSPVSRVVVRTPDGRFFLASCAAVPTQAGWLLVQL